MQMKAEFEKSISPRGQKRQKGFQLHLKNIKANQAGEKLKRKSNQASKTATLKLKLSTDPIALKKTLHSGAGSSTGGCKSHSKLKAVKESSQDARLEQPMELPLIGNVQATLETLEALPHPQQLLSYREMASGETVAAKPSPSNLKNLDYSEHHLQASQADRSSKRYKLSELALKVSLVPAFRKEQQIATEDYASASSVLPMITAKSVGPQADQNCEQSLPDQQSKDSSEFARIRDKHEKMASQSRAIQHRFKSSDGVKVAGGIFGLNYDARWEQKLGSLDVQSDGEVLVFNEAEAEMDRMKMQTSYLVAPAQLESRSQLEQDTLTKDGSTLLPEKRRKRVRRKRREPLKERKLSNDQIANLHSITNPSLTSLSAIQQQSVKKNGTSKSLADFIANINSQTSLRKSRKNTKSLLNAYNCYVTKTGLDFSRLRQNRALSKVQLKKGMSIDSKENAGEEGISQSSNDSHRLAQISEEQNVPKQLLNSDSDCLLKLKLNIDSSRFTDRGPTDLRQDEHSGLLIKIGTEAASSDRVVETASQIEHREDQEALSVQSEQMEGHEAASELEAVSPGLDANCNQKEDSDMNQKYHGSLQNGQPASASPPVRKKQFSQQSGKRTYELHNLTQSSSIIDHLIKSTEAKAPNRTESIQVAKQACAQLTNKPPKQSYSSQPNTADPLQDRQKSRKKTLLGSTLMNTQTRDDETQKQIREPIRDQFITEEDSLGGLDEMPIESQDFEPDHQKIKNWAVLDSKERENGTTSSRTCNSKIERGNSQALVSNEERNSRQSKEMSLYQQRGLKSSSKLRLQNETKQSQDGLLAAGTSQKVGESSTKSGLPAIIQPVATVPATHSRRNGVKGSSMMTNKSKKESQTTWGADWPPVPVLAEARKQYIYESGPAGSKRKNLRRQQQQQEEMTDNVKNLPLSSFSFRTTDFNTAEKKEGQKQKSTLPRALPDSKTTHHQAHASETANSIQLKLKSMNQKTAGQAPEALSAATNGQADPIRKTMLSKKRGTQDQKLIQSSFFFIQDQDQQARSGKVKRRERVSNEQQLYVDQYNSIDMSEGANEQLTLGATKTSEEKRQQHSRPLRDQLSKEKSLNMRTIPAHETPKQPTSHKVGLLLKSYAANQDKRRILNQRLDSVTKQNQVSLKAGSSVSPMDRSQDQMKSAKAIKFGSPKNSSIISKAQRTSVAFAKNGYSRPKEALFVNGYLGVFNKSPFPAPKTDLSRFQTDQISCRPYIKQDGWINKSSCAQLHALENKLTHIPASSAPTSKGIGCSTGKQTVRKQSKESAYLSATRVRDKSKLNSSGAAVNTATNMTITSDGSLYSPYQKKPNRFPQLKQGSSMLGQQDESAAQVYANFHSANQNSTGKRILAEASKTSTYRRKFPGMTRETSTSYGNFERLAQEQVHAFVHQGAHERVTLHEQLTHMIFKNVHSLAEQTIDSREVAREKEIIRNSLKGKTYEDLAKLEQQTRSTSKMLHSRMNDQFHTNSTIKEIAEETIPDQPVTRTEQLSKALQVKKSSTIVLSFRSQDKWFKRAALARGWVENAGHGSHLFNVKWEFSDSSQDVYKQLRNNQFYNHFPDSRELTTKQGLNHNLHNITIPGVDIYSFYPRCYDLSDQRQVDLFQDDFNRTAILCCLKKHARYFKEQCGDILKEIEAKDKLISNNKWREESKRQLKRSYIGKHPPQGSIQKINTILLRNAIFYARSLLLLDQDCEGDEFLKRNYYQPTFQFNQRILNIVVKYAELEVPLNMGYFERQVPGLGSIDEDREMDRLYYNEVLRFRGWEIPNVYVMYQAYKMHKLLKAKYPQYRSIDGADNVWICKPSFTARGVGIFCFRSLRELFNGQTKKHMCPKIVQKYVERSFLLEKKAIPQLTNQVTIDLKGQARRNSLSPQKILSASPQRRTHYSTLKQSFQSQQDDVEDLRKFDFRQWVYVNSFDPMSVFIYRKAYLRICGAHFDLTQFEDAQRHISNYSVQKDHELVLSSDDFIEYLKRIDPGKYGQLTWESWFLPQVDHIVKSTLTQMAEVIENRMNSFELFGFDFVVDKDLRLWLIEVNMSPACAERQPWLTDMLDDMAAGLVGMIMAKVNAHRDSIEASSAVINPNNQNGTASDQQQRLKLYKKLQKQNLMATIENTNWSSMSKCDGFLLMNGDRQMNVKIPQSQIQININPSNFEKQNLELLGKKANLKMERYMDQMCQRASAIQFIQKVYRGHLVRKKLLQQRQLKVKAATQKKMAVRVITENLQLAFDRVKQIDKRKAPFSRLKRLFFHDIVAQKISSDPLKLAKIVCLQRLARSWLSRQHIGVLGSEHQLPSQGEIIEAEITLSPRRIEPHKCEDPVLLTGTRKKLFQGQRILAATIELQSDYDESFSAKNPMASADPSLIQTPQHELEFSEMVDQQQQNVATSRNNNLKLRMQSSATMISQNKYSGKAAAKRKEVIQSQTSINFHKDERIVQRSGTGGRVGTPGVVKQTRSVHSQSASASRRQNTRLTSKANGSSQGEVGRPNLTATEPAEGQVGKHAVLVRHEDQNYSGKERSSSVLKKQKVLSQQLPMYQLDSFMLLDYQAVGVDLIIPVIELQKGRKLRQFASKLQQVHQSESQANLSHSSKYRYRVSQGTHNYAFSPRYDCQQSAQVNAYASAGGANSKERQQSTQLQLFKDEAAKRQNHSKKVKNQIMAAYVDHRVRIRPIKPPRES